MKKIRLIIADDHSIVRSGLKLLLRNNPEFSVIGEAADGAETIKLVAQRKPDVAIIDISMPTMNGIEATKILKKNSPNTRILILTMHESEEYVYQMVRAGASGYVLKDAAKKELFTALRAVAGGEQFFSPGISKLMIDEFIKRARESELKHPLPKNVLTAREKEVLQHIAEGLTNQEIASKLFLSVRTVDTHRTNIKKKLNIRDIAGLVRYAIENALVSVNIKP